MIKLSIGDVLKGKPSIDESYRIYVVHDGDTVFYVGQSNNIVKRLSDHTSARLRSLLGDLIEDNLPESLDWTVDAMNLNDCAPFVRKMNPGAVSFDSVDVAERVMIQTLNPCLNRMHNTNHSVPSKYRQRDYDLGAISDTLAQIFGAD